jgi:hypothetical protein
VSAEWAVGNYLRIVLILSAVVLVMTSMIRIARETAPEEHRLSCNAFLRRVLVHLAA